MSHQVTSGVVDIPLSGHSPGGRTGPTSNGRESGSVGTFVVGPENRLVEAAVVATLGDSESCYTPIVFFGPPGVGKSHLAIGLAAAWKAARPGQSVIGIAAIDFARQLADAVETKTVDDFGIRYRQASLLVMEDLGHLMEKAAAQQELIHTLDALAETGGRAVLTSRVPPGQLDGMMPRLRSRLTAGLTVPVAPPGPEARLAIVTRLAEAQGIGLPESAAQVLATQLTGTVPELRGVLSQLSLSAEIEARSIDVAQVEEHLRERASQKAPAMEEIARATARHFSLKLSDLRSTSRARALVAARGVAMYLARSMSGLTLEEIGRYFGGRDHTTVSYGCRKTGELIESEPAIRQAVSELRRKLESG